MAASQLHSWPLFFVAFAIFVAGCSDGGSPAKVKIGGDAKGQILDELPRDPGSWKRKKRIRLSGGETPTECFENIQGASEWQEWREMMANLTPDSQTAYAGVYVYIGVIIRAFAKDGDDEEVEAAKKLEVVFEKHGLTRRFLDQARSPAGTPDPIPLFRNLSDPIEDCGAFLADFEAVSRGSKEGPLPRDTVLKDILIIGDFAEGVIRFDDKGTMRSTRITFNRINGKWLADIGEFIQYKIDSKRDGQVANP